MKKIAAILLTAVTALVLFGCSGQTPEVDFDAVAAAFKAEGFLVLGPSRPYRQIAFHAYNDDGEEIWIFLHETNSDASTAYDAARFFVLGRSFEGVTMRAYRIGRLIFYGTEGALNIFEPFRE